MFKLRSILWAATILVAVPVAATDQNGWTGPLVFQVERVAYTPLGAGCLFDASILCSDTIRADAPDMDN